MALQYLKGAKKKDAEGRFTRACSERMGGFKLKLSRFKLYIRKKNPYFEYSIF